MNSVPLISIVLPAHNEEDNIIRIYSELRAELPDQPTEIIFVDDGSRDATAERVQTLQASDPLVRLVRFSRNFGNQAALLAGIRVAKGAAVVTMDCDLQHPPKLLPRMVQVWREGSPVVQMVRRENEGARLLKKLTSSMFYRVMATMSDSPVMPGSDFQLLDRKVVDALFSFKDRRPFLRGMVSYLGFPSRQLHFVAPRRQAGASSFSWLRLWALSLDAVTGLSRKPLRLALYLGLCISGLCFCYSVVIVTAFMQGRTVPGWPSLIMTLLFLGAVQLLSIGILGEYIGRIYDQTRQVPPFVVMEDSGAPPVEAVAAEEVVRLPVSGRPRTK